jgi:hypothetical protein
VGSSPSGAADFYKDIVPNSDTALRIAEAVFEAYYGKEEFLRMTRNSPLVAELEGDNWLVFSYPKQKGENKKPGEINVTAGGGKPSVMISKKNGEIINIYLSR